MLFLISSVLMVAVGSAFVVVRRKRKSGAQATH